MQLGLFLSKTWRIVPTYYDYGQKMLWMVLYIRITKEGSYHNCLLFGLLSGQALANGVG